MRIQAAPALLALWILSAYSAPAAALGAQTGLPWLPRGAAERHIPRGELAPQVIEKVYASPRGEVQFTVIEAMNPVGHSGFLRNNRGNLMGFTEVRGGGDCEKWFMSAKSDPLPRGCEFLFYDSADGRTMSIRSDEMQESDIFGLASGELQAQASRGAQALPHGLATPGGIE